ncbi:MAG: peptidylprolyl isomerase [Coriobacteriia bacterium]|nr:peptidylprolyl isomerase [Coriobacteriia bacterium]
MTRFTRPVATALAAMLVLVAVAATGCTDKDVVATVNGSPIKIQAVDEQLAQMKKSSPQTFEGTSGVKMETEFKAKILESLIQLELIKQAAASLKVDVTEKQVDDYIKQLETQYGGKTGLETAMKQSGIELPQLRDSIKNRLMVDEVSKKSQAASATITDAAIKAYYDQNKAMFGGQTEVDAQHILVASKDKKLAEEILAKVKKGDDFAALAKKYSTDPGSKANDGKLGWAPATQYVPEFAKATQEMKIGEVRLVETQFGWHIIKLLGRKEAKQKELAEVKGQITTILEQQGQSEGFQKYVDDLKKKAKIEILDPALKKLIDAQAAATPAPSK